MVAPTSYWTCNESSGTTAAESIGSLDISGAAISFTTGQLNNCFTFTAGAGAAYATAQHTDFTLGTGNFTVCYWVKSTGTGATILQHEGGDWGTLLESGGQATWLPANLQAADVHDGNWHRCIFSRTGTGTNLMKIYVDGSLSATGTEATNFTTLGCIKGWRDATVYLDDIRIYKGYGFDATDVTNDWNSGAGVEYSADVTITPSALALTTSIPAPTDIIIYAPTMAMSGTINIGNVGVRVYEATGGRGTRFIKTRYPFTKGLVAGTTRQEGTKTMLNYQKSFVSNRDKQNI